MKYNTKQLIAAQIWFESLVSRSNLLRLFIATFLSPLLNFTLSSKRRGGGDKNLRCSQVAGFRWNFAPGTFSKNRGKTSPPMELFQFQSGGVAPMQNATRTLVRLFNTRREGSTSLAAKLLYPATCLARRELLIVAFRAGKILRINARSEEEEALIDWFSQRRNISIWLI